MRKIIWSFWDGPKNYFVEKSYASWKKYCPDWDINFLNLETIKNYNIKKPKNFDQLTPTKKSDVIRLSLVYNYGGLWLDATVVLHEDLNWFIQKMKDYPYFGYLHSKNKCHIENWLIAVNSEKDYSIGKWRDTFIQIIDNPDEKPGYFDCYKAYCYLNDNDPKFKKIHDSIPFIVGFRFSFGFRFF